MRNTTQRERITQQIMEAYGIGAEYLWLDSPHNAVFRHPASGKWFGAMMRVAKERLGLAGEGFVEILDVKCDPILIGSLRREVGFLPAYHMNKSAWITILLDETVPDERIGFLLGMSYELVAPRAKAKAERK